jgi:hypothetical protein|tara:strand:+ start:1641 stop:3413 length:1773 start_codon:yes stop_codon:yes gene_type:complete
MNKIFISIVFLIVTLVSCDDDFLNEPPLDRITENDVWSDAALMDTYIFKIYDIMPWDFLSDFGGGAGWGAQRDALSDLAMSTYSWTPANNSIRSGNWGTSTNYWPLDWWGYDKIYKLNYSIEQITPLGTEVMTEEERDNRLGELYFMRAFSYFEMAKRYGGIPIILETQDPDNTPLDKYYPPRNTEQEVYDQIIADARLAFEMLPDKWSSQKGRAPKWAAKGLESRAALYAGSIAKYGSIDLDGLVGINSGAADDYYNIALNAGIEIINNGGYSLFDKYPDKSENYYHLFVDESEDESIFVKVWLPYEKGHSYDLHNTPYSYRVDWGSSMSPSKQLMDSYEMISTGLLPSEAGSGYDSNNPFEGRDPRFKGTLFTNGDLFQGSTIETWYGTEYNGVLDTGPDTGVGKDGMGIHPDATKTGAYVRKYLSDGSVPLLIQQYYSGQDGILMRLGEMYLNVAEAAIELGLESEARDYIEPIRKRAGLIENLGFESYSGITLRDRIRNERKIELAFEDHRYWDCRRWRTAEVDLSIQVQGIRSLRKIDAAGNVSFTYDFFDAETEQMHFDSRHYYLPIGQDRRNNNANLLENPGY